MVAPTFLSVVPQTFLSVDLFPWGGGQTGMSVPPETPQARMPVPPNPETGKDKDRAGWKASTTTDPMRRITTPPTMLSRRTMLRGLGVTLALPWLEAMGPM